MYSFGTQPLPRDINTAQLLLQDHLANYQAVSDLFNLTSANAQDVLGRSATSAAVSVSREEIKSFLERSEDRHEEWRSLWEHHKEKLEESVRLCEFEQAINKVLTGWGRWGRLGALRALPDEFVVDWQRCLKTE